MIGTRLLTFARAALAAFVSMTSNVNRPDGHRSSYRDRV